MSQFRKLVENVLKEYYTKSGKWTNDPQDEYTGEDEYYEWLENQDYKEGYAVFLGKDEEGKDLFATADKSIPDDPDYKPSTQILGGDPVLPEVFEYSWGSAQEEANAKEKAEEFANEWKQLFPDSQPEVVRVYAINKDDYEFYRNKEEIYPYEDWDYGEYLADKREAEAEMRWEEQREMGNY